jgi:hypothetical protein
MTEHEAIDQEDQRLQQRRRDRRERETDDGAEVFVGSGQRRHRRMRVPSAALTPASMQVMPDGQIPSLQSFEQ